MNILIQNLLPVLLTEQLLRKWIKLEKIFNLLVISTQYLTNYQSKLDLEHIIYSNETYPSFNEIKQHIRRALIPFRRNYYDKFYTLKGIHRIRPWTPYCSRILQHITNTFKIYAANNKSLLEIQKFIKKRMNICMYHPRTKYQKNYYQNQKLNLLIISYAKSTRIKTEKKDKKKTKKVIIFVFHFKYILIFAYIL